MTGADDFLQISPSLPKNVKPVGAVIAAVRVLRYLSDAEQPVGVSQVAKAVGLYSSTCFNILRTLAQEDLVLFDENTKTYTLGLGIIEFAQGILSKGGFISAIQAQMHDVAHKGGFSLTLWRRMPNGHNVVIISEDSGRAVQIHIGVGQRLPEFIGATGRVIAAAERTPADVLKRHFDQLRWETPLSFDEFLESIEESREKGWAIDDGTYRTGLVTIAVPVTDQAGVVRLIIAAHMFRGQFSDARQEDIAHRLQEIAARARQLGTINAFA